jgi:hypothetical protein
MGIPALPGASVHADDPHDADNTPPKAELQETPDNA